MKRIIVWFRKDLRLEDHPALTEAIREGMILPLYIWAPHEELHGRSEQASSWWLFHSLNELKSSLEKLGSTLIIRAGDSLSVLQTMIRTIHADAVFFNERYEPTIRDRDTRIVKCLQAEQIEVKTFKSHLVFDPIKVLNNQNQPYKVFTPFWKQSYKIRVEQPLPSPARNSFLTIQNVPESNTLDELGLLPKFDWYHKFGIYWKPGEQGAKARWFKFLENGISGYQTGRDVPSLDSVSRLSPHLAWGELSPRWIWNELKERTEAREASKEQAYRDDFESFIRQLVWREFAYNQMFFFPNMLHRPLRAEFEQFPWENNEDALSRWKQGMTGYPLIDAGMRQLWETGWIHNRVRMVAASFLVKHLMVHWKKGAEWFEQTLLDIDAANNAMGWQWVSGCGFDSAPYFRIFNPITQSQKFDPNGTYIRKWVPELASLPTKYLHFPWTAPKEVLEESGIRMGATYPTPVIDHAFARERALYAYQIMKQ